MPFARVLTALLVSGSLAGVLLSTGVAEAAPPGDGWTLTFADEFDGSSLDGAKWNGSGWVDNPGWEIQGYRTQNVEVSGGTCKLNVKKEGFDTFHYSSGKIT